MTDSRTSELDGLFGSPRARVSVRESLGVPGTASAERVLLARQFDALEFEVLPSRGFDIGDTWFRGVPVSWFSPVQDARALPPVRGREWLSRFTGGLLTTCGFGTIGDPANGEGLHGAASSLPADEVSWQVDDDMTLRLRGVIQSVALFGPSFRLCRSITASTDAAGNGRVRVVDAVTNVGPEPAALSLMYHLNFGAPLVAPGSTVEIDGTGCVASAPYPDVPRWERLPEPVGHLTEAVFEHTGVKSDAAGFARARIESSVRDLAVVIEWSAKTLPRLHQWVFPTRGRWALAIEPATAPLFGPDRESEHAGAPVVSPGDTRIHEVRFTVGPRSVASN